MVQAFRFMAPREALGQASRQRLMLPSGMHGVCFIWIRGYIYGCVCVCVLDTFPIPPRLITGGPISSAVAATPLFKCL